jgi:signal transduction histidine kinase
VRAQKLASIGQVAAGVAHEINNPLGVILGYVKTMRRTPTRDDEGLDVIEEEALLCRRIVDGLLDLARPQTLSLEQVDLDALIGDCIERLRAAGKLSGCRIEPPRADPSHRLEADPGKLRQVLLNVITNAAEASAPDGRVSVHIEAGEDDVTVDVKDSGPGLAPEIRAKVFEPFVTTKKGGVGLGLAIAHAIVDAHHGTIACATPAGANGTVVRMTFPVGAGRRVA